MKINKHIKPIFKVFSNNTLFLLPKAFPENTLTPLAIPSIKYTIINIISNITAFAANVIVPKLAPAIANKLLIVNKQTVLNIKSVFTFIIDKKGFIFFNSCKYSFVIFNLALK